MTEEQAQELYDDLCKEFYIRAKHAGIDMSKLNAPGNVILNILNGSNRGELEKLELGLYWFGNKFEDVPTNCEILMKVIKGHA